MVTFLFELTMICRTISDLTPLRFLVPDASQMASEGVPVTSTMAAGGRTGPLGTERQPRA